MWSLHRIVRWKANPAVGSSRNPVESGRSIKGDWKPALLAVPTAFHLAAIALGVSVGWVDTLPFHLVDPPGRQSTGSVRGAPRKT